MSPFSYSHYSNLPETSEAIFLTANHTRVSGCEGVAIALADGVAAAAAVLAIIGVVALAPRLGVEGAVGSLGNTVLREDISVDEVLFNH